MALRQIWLEDIERADYRNASIIATLYNAHFDAKGVPWTAEDLMGRGNRDQRKHQQMVDKMASLKMTKIVDTLHNDAELPAWATRAEAWKVN